VRRHRPQHDIAQTGPGPYSWSTSLSGTSVPQSFYQLKPTGLAGASVLKPPVFGDDRGYFSPTFNAEALRDAGISAEFTQDNQSLSRQVGTVRGLHAQRAPYEQAKLVRVLRGRALDVAVDGRPGSETFGQWFSHELSADNHEQLFIPRGFLHGFMTLEPDTILAYKVDNAYAPDHEFSVRWNDPDLAIRWPDGVKAPLLSERDAAAISWADYLEMIGSAGS